jgi:hypothetical protein
MSTSLRFFACLVVLLCFSFFSHAQILKNIGNRTKQKAEQRANQKVDQAIDKGLDKTEDAAKKKDDTQIHSRIMMAATPMETIKVIPIPLQAPQVLKPIQNLILFRVIK